MTYIKGEKRSGRSKYFPYLGTYLLFVEQSVVSLLLWNSKSFTLPQPANHLLISPLYNICIRVVVYAGRFVSHHSIDEIIDWEWSYWQIYEDHKLPSVVTRDLEHDSSRALDSELGHQIRNDFLSHESRLVGSSLAIRDLRVQLT